MSVTDPAPLPAATVGLPPRTRTEWDLPAAQVAAAAHLQQLLADPPNGHTPDPQPAAWYDAVFDDIAACCPDPCACPPRTEGDAR